jgi:hypothetical protein
VQSSLERELLDELLLYEHHVIRKERLIGLIHIYTGSCEGEGKGKLEPGVMSKKGQKTSIASGKKGYMRM